MTLVNVGQVSGLPPGPYWWFVIVDDDSNDVPDGRFVDVVLTIVPGP